MPWNLPFLVLFISLCRSICPFWYHFLLCKDLPLTFPTVWICGQRIFPPAFVCQKKKKSSFSRDIFTGYGILDWHLSFYFQYSIQGLHCLFACLVFNEKHAPHPYTCAFVYSVSVFLWILWEFSLLSLFLSNLSMIGLGTVVFIVLVPVIGIPGSILSNLKNVQPLLYEIFSVPLPHGEFQLHEC